MSSILTNEERAELGLPPSAWDHYSEIRTSYSDFHETRYEQAAWKVAKQPIGSESIPEWNGDRVYRTYKAFRDGIPGTIVYDDFHPAFGHASNGGATWRPD